uniref:Uncharacterized protein n=1 Tax=Rhizophora mucronata TaxID=61149 RepID=A0A2P2LRU5_RHIMU
MNYKISVCLEHFLVTVDLFPLILCISICPTSVTGQVLCKHCFFDLHLLP